MNYSFDKTKFINDILPDILRQPINIAYLEAMLAALGSLHTEFLTYRSALLEQMSINSQTMLMEYYLNKNYNGSLSGIYITNQVVAYPSVYIGYSFESGHEIYIGYGDSDLTIPPDVYIGYVFEQSDTAFDFIINIPAALEGAFDVGSMNAWVKKYTFSGKRWMFNYY